MTPDLETLETSFDLIAPRGEELVDTFYARLFEAAPAVQPLFAHTDMRKQKAMLLATLVLLRKSLRDLEAITPKLRQLGARHVAYGARPEHYPVVAEVLLASMAELAGDAWTPDVEAAWAGALGLVATAMLEGAAEAEAQEQLEAASDPNHDPKEREPMLSPKKSLVAIAVLAAVVSTVLFAGAALAANGGNSDNARLCQDWPALMDSSGAQFSNEGACVSSAAHGGAIYALASLTVEASANQPFDGISVSTSGFGLAPTTFATTSLSKNGTEIKFDALIVPASGIVNGSPFGTFEAPCVAGNIWSATATGTSADSLSTPTMPGIPVTSNTVTRTSTCP